MRNRKLTGWGKKRTLGLGVGGALAMLAATALPGAASAATTATTVKLSASPLGLNIAPWDPLYSNATSLKVLQPLLKKAGMDNLRYGGGVTADEYDWKTDSSIQNCPTMAASGFTSSCAIYDALDFTKFSANARAIGAQSNVTVNYGTGSPLLAAAWVKHAKTTAGEAVAQWEVGNENYGCWEANNPLGGPPVRYKGYKPNDGATCPMNTLGLDAGMTAMATSYASNAKNFMIDMKQQDPSAQVGVPYAFDNTVGGATVGDNAEWNDTVLKADAKYISFVDAHWYPFGYGGTTGVGSNPSAQTIIQSVKQIPGEYAKIRADLNKYDSGAKVVIGETGVSYLATSVACEPTGALFAAGDVLSWLAAGAQTVDWWQLDTGANTGTKCVKPEEGMFTAGTPSPLSYYMGYYLAAFLAQPGAQLKTLSTTDSTDVLAFQSVLSNGKVAVALINTNTSSAETVKFSSALAGKLTVTSYRADDQNALNTRTLTGSNTAASVAGGIRLPAESILVLKTS